MNTAVLFSTGKDDWQTPPELLAALRAEFTFGLDVAATRDNAVTGCPCYCGPDHVNESMRDGLTFEWPDGLSDGEVAWCNPPYSRGLQKQFIERAAYWRAMHDVTTVMLLPARTDTIAFHRYIWDAEKHQPRPGVEVRFLKGRLKFVGAKDAAPFPSMLVVFRGEQRSESPVGVPR